MSFKDLRQFLDYLAERGELVTIDEPVDPRYEVAAYIRKSSDLGGPTLLFKNVRGFDMPVVGGVFCSPKKALLALETTDHREAVARFAAGLHEPIEPRRVASGPCKEIKLVGDEVDLTRLPICTYGEQDGGAYITVGVGISKDPETGVPNAGMYRMHYYDRQHTGLRISPYADLHVMLARAEAQGRPLEHAVALGVDPLVQLASQAHVPYGTNEVAIAGGLRGEPVEVVACETVDLEVPATAEIVLEGRLLPGERRWEGPFGEFTGYVSPATNSPIFECTAITMRQGAIFQAGLTGAPVTENHVLKFLPLEANLLAALRETYPGVTDVNCVPESGEFLVVIALKQRYANEAKNVLLNALGSVVHPKMVVVTDDDVDIHNMTQVWWAILTRCQPAEDVIIVPRAAGGQLDPSAPAPFTNSLMGMDATRPFGKPFPEVVRIPGVEQVPDFWRRLGARG
ncbi:MAG: UbiD family decarboxylase [Chloroflexi bacterium]|nr:UbiD family decarboxylase [Chloroflexota bacterium]